MKYAKELEEILEKKKFTSMWQCVTYLQTSGFPTIDCIGLSLKKFGEDAMFTDVAFARQMVEVGQDGVVRQQSSFRTESLNRLIPTRPLAIQRIEAVSYRYGPSIEFYDIELGLVDDTNRHLTGVYEAYRRNVKDGRIFDRISEIEKTCELIKITGLSEFFLDYIEVVATKHFGHSLNLNKYKSK